MSRAHACPECGHESSGKFASTCDLHALAPRLLKALRAMALSHGAHGPCKGNDCSDCRRAYTDARALITAAGGARG